MGLTNFIREVTGAPHYRRSATETARYAYAKWLFRRSRRQTPTAFLEGIGIDPTIAFSGLNRWLPQLKYAVSSVDVQRGQGGISLKDGVILYGLARALKPDYVIETGVAAGVSTSFFSAALIENGRGLLFSIELPPANSEDLPQADGSVYSWKENGVGWALPEEIKRGLGKRHRLILQDVRQALPELLRQLPHVDIFFHDDLHTPDHMLWEYQLVWPKIRPGGALASDDVNHGWIKFCEQLELDRASFNNVDRFCALRKPSPEGAAIQAIRDGAA